MTGTPLYDALVSAVTPDQAEMMLRDWSPTPWVLQVFTDAAGSPHDMAMRRWCVAEFGPESLPLNGAIGRWRRGASTSGGYGLIGFNTEAAMHEFQRQWGGAPDVE